MDNTYLSAAFEFPSQSQALRELVGMLERKPAYRSYTVLVGVDTLGKERLLVDLAMYFGSRVEVSHGRRVCTTQLNAFFAKVAPERYLALQRIFECGELLQEHFELFFDAQHPPSNYGAGSVFSPPSLPLIHCVGQGPLFVLSSRRGLGLELAKRKETLLLQNPQQTPLVLGVIPTGWVSSEASEVQMLVAHSFLSAETTQKKPKHESHAAMLRVPYSIHSSYGEILELIRRARPCRVGCSVWTCRSVSRSADTTAQVVPIVPDSPCPYDVISPLLSGEAPRSIDYAEAGVDMDATAPVRAVAGGSKRPRAQVSAERAAQIADATRRERERLRVKQEEIKVKRDGAMSNKEIIIVRDHSGAKLAWFGSLFSCCTQMSSANWHGNRRCGPAMELLRPLRWTCFAWCAAVRRWQGKLNPPSKHPPHRFMPISRT